MVMKIKQIIYNHLRKHLNCNQLTHKCVKTKPFDRKLKENECFNHKFVIDLKQFEGIVSKEIENSLSKVSELV